MKRGEHVKIIKGVSKGRIGIIDRIHNHSWFAVYLPPDGYKNFHSSYLELATQAEIERMAQ